MSRTLSTEYDPSYPVQIYELAKSGLTDREISKQLNPPVPFRVLLQWKHKKNEVSASLEIGRRYAETNQGNQLTDPKQIAFLMAYGEKGTLLESSRLAGMHIQRHYKWMETDEQYAKAFELAKLRFAESLVSSATVRARDGLKEYKFHNGKPVYVECEPTHPEAKESVDPDTGQRIFVRHYYVRRYSDRLMTQMLQALDPRFKEQGATTNVNVRTGDQLIQQVLHDVESTRGTVIDDDYLDDITDAVVTKKLEHKDQ